MNELKPGMAIMYGEPNGSWGTIECANNYGGFYVRWNYGKDVSGEPITSLSSVRPNMLIPISWESYTKYINCRAWTPEQRKITEEELECQREKKKTRFL